MKKIFEYLGVFAVLIFSFFYAEKVALIVQSKNPLMEEINTKKEDLKTLHVNALIQGEYIIPGSNGLEIDSLKSFRNMQEFGIFNEYYLVYNQVKPDISLTNNKDKIIKNTNKNAVSLVFESIGELSNYASNHKINVLINSKNYNVNNNCELINASNTKEEFSNLEALLNKNKRNNHICLLNDKNLEICKKYGNYLAEASLSLNSTNIAEIKRNLKKGIIILIKDNARLIDLEILIKEISYKGMDIIFLSKLLSEDLVSSR